jgi:protoporphyrinogen/coproporphyrinogen III oxidase
MNSPGGLRGRTFSARAGLDSPGVQRIGVIGGGLAGLTVAFRRATRGDRVVLAEPARLGGQLFTERRDGFVVEHGAEGFVARSEAVAALARDLGIGGDLIDQCQTRSFGFDGARLVELGPGEAAAFLGFQVPRDELGKGIRSFRCGMGQLSDALAKAAAATARASVLHGRVTTLTPRGDGWRMELEGGEREDVDAVVVATTAATAAPLLERMLGEPARALAGAPTLSSCTVTLAYTRDAVGHPLDGTGFVVAQAHQEHGFRAVTFITSKFLARAPEGHVSLRVFFRPSADDLASMTDGAWTARAEASLRRVFPIAGPPVHAWVSRWAAALPVFDPARVDAVRVVTEGLAGRRVLLAGAAFHGSGIDAAVRSAEAAAQALA